MNPRRNLQTRKNRRKRNERWESRMRKIRGAVFSHLMQSGKPIKIGSPEWRNYMHEFAARMYIGEYRRLVSGGHDAE